MVKVRGDTVKLLDGPAANLRTDKGGPTDKYPNVGPQ